MKRTGNPPLVGLTPREADQPSMQIEFEIDGEDAVFTRNSVTGRAELRVADGVLVLQSPWNPATHVTFNKTKRWCRRIRDREVVVEMLRPMFFAGVRPQKFRILVDGVSVAEQEGI